jgi:hypothetical protein
MPGRGEIFSPAGGVMSLYGMGRYGSGGLRPPELFFGNSQQTADSADIADQLLAAVQRCRAGRTFPSTTWRDDRCVVPYFGSRVLFELRITRLSLRLTSHF